MFGESESRSVVSDSLRPHGLYSTWNSPGKITGVGSLSFLQGIFPTQGSNPGLPHCSQILCQLSHKEFTSEIIWSRVFIWGKSSDYSSESLVIIGSDFLYLHDSVLVICVFLIIYLCLLDYPIFWYTIVHRASYYPSLVTQW